MMPVDSVVSSVQTQKQYFTCMHHFSCRAVPQQFISWYPVLRCNELRHSIRIIEEGLHAYERLSAFLCQQWPRLWTSEQVTDRSLRQAEDSITKQTLTDGKLAQNFLYLQPIQTWSNSWLTLYIYITFNFYCKNYCSTETLQGIIKRDRKHLKNIFCCKIITNHQALNNWCTSHSIRNRNKNRKIKTKHLLNCCSSLIRSTKRNFAQKIQQLIKVSSCNS